MTKKLIHTRTIVVKVYDERDDAISIEGSIEDIQPTGSNYFKHKLDI